MQTKTRYENKCFFDTDSYSIGIDNRATTCISHKVHDFVGPLMETDKVIMGYNGSRTSDIKIGTIKWSWQDDEGKIHEHIIKNSIYSPSGGVRLLSPQAWSQSKATHQEKLHTKCETTNKSAILTWGPKGQYKRTVPLGIHDNVATF